MNIKQLLAKRKQLAEQQAACMTEGREHDAFVIEGQIKQLDEQIEQAAEDDAEIRNAATSHPVAAEPASLAARVLGERGTFNGIGDGFRKSAPLRNAVTGLGTPQIYNPDLPAPVAPPTGFLSTILRGTTDGDEHFFRTPVLTNAAAEWTNGDKPQSALAWTEAVAHISTIAHHIPIKKQTANRYSQLESIVNGALMLGLALKCNELVLRGANSSGIVGVTNTSGILTHSKSDAKNLKDTLAAMKRKVRVATGIAPTHVCLSPYAIEELSEEKDKADRYLFPEIGNGGTIAGLTVVEDVNMTTTGDAPKETALVYYNGAASFDIADPEEIIIGLVNSQLIQNEYTILAELTAALRVDTPAGFCYCSDLKIAGE